jgi:poly-gamma-glutamate capsule biosynthesis protein CapA/YwtB (metallophosphatase superfamily)
MNGEIAIKCLPTSVNRLIGKRVRIGNRNRLVDFRTIKLVSFAVGLVAALLSLAVPSQAETWQGSNADDRQEIFTIAAVGDVMMGSTYPVDILPPDDGQRMFDGVTYEFQNSDLVLGNLEGVIADNVKPTKCKVPLQGGCFEFVMPSRYARHLKKAGFTVMNIANNHILDAGFAGAEATIETLLGAGIIPAGGGRVVSLQWRDKTLAVVGFSYKASPYAYSIQDIAQAEETIAALKGQNNLVIVSFHGGAEGKDALHIPRRNETYMGESRGDVVKFAHAVIDAGADMVVGHGPHVVRALELYRGKLIAYSLGNFLTFAVFNLKGPSGISVMLKARIDGKSGNFIDGKLVPLRLVDGGIPVIDPSAEAIDLMRSLTAADIKPPTIVIGPGGAVRPLHGK